MFLAFVAVFISLLFILFVTVHCETNFPVNLCWDNKYSDSEKDRLFQTQHANFWGKPLCQAAEQHKLQINDEKLYVGHLPSCGYYVFVPTNT